MPLEIKQLVIKSQTINDDNKTPSFAAERPGIAPEENVSVNVLPYHFMSSPDEARER
ncbi:hypothetical protein [Kluyvera sp. 142486]|uniref:hypothetical protein n=1 Tax=Kluyvera sp. 142486 TaxID=3390050 RepID=UPI00397EB3B3